MSRRWVNATEATARNIEQIKARMAAEKELSELKVAVRAAMDLANGRWSEWGERALLVAEALDRALLGEKRGER